MCVFSNLVAFNQIDSSAVAREDSNKTPRLSEIFKVSLTELVSSGYGSPDGTQHPPRILASDVGALTNRPTCYP